MGRASCGHVLHGVMMSMTAWGKRVCVKADFEVAHAEAFSVERTLWKTLRKVTCCHVTLLPKWRLGLLVAWRQEQAQTRGASG